MTGAEDNGTRYYDTEKFAVKRIVVVLGTEEGDRTRWPQPYLQIEY
jgi:hypothetical protein